MLRNFIRYLTLFTLVGVLSILYDTYYMSILFFALGVVPFFLFALLAYLYSRVSVSMLSVVHVAKRGEVVPISILVNNPTIFPISSLKIILSYKNAYSPLVYKKSVMVSIDSNTKASVICNLLSDYAGNLEITLRSVRVYDYLKLFSLKKRLKGELKVAVLPVYYELSENQLQSRSPSLSESDNYSALKSGDDPSEVFAIREYREGDRQQRIHWKLSRKFDQLMIKEFSDPLNCSLLLFADFCIPKGVHPMQFMDSMLECTLSMSYSLTLAGQPHYFAWYDVRHGGCRRIRVMQEKDFFEAVDGLLQALPHAADSDGLSAYLAEHPKEQYTNLIFLTGEQPRYRMETLILLKAAKRHVIYIGDIDNQPGMKYFPNEIIKKSNDVGVALYPVDTNHIQRDMELLILE